MSRYRKVDPRIWNDEKFASLSDAAKLVFFMLLTHPSMTALGAMRATTSGLAEELGWTPEAFREAFRELSAKGLAEHDQRACLIALPKFLRYNSPESPNVVKAWAHSVDLLPECQLKTRVVARARAYAEGLKEGFGEAFRQVFGKGMPIQEQEQEQESIPTTSGAGAPSGGVDKSVEPIDVIFAYGVPLLTAASVPETSARKMLGMMRKQHGDAAVAKAIERCGEQQAIEPVSFLQGALKAIVRSGTAVTDTGPPWWSSHAGIDKKARELGMQARGSESYDDFKVRIFDRLRATKEAA